MPVEKGQLNGAHGECKAMTYRPTRGKMSFAIKA